MLKSVALLAAVGLSICTAGSAFAWSGKYTSSSHRTTVHRSTTGSGLSNEPRPYGTKKVLHCKVGTRNCPPRGLQR
jgi:hypothetical protein